MISIVIPTYNNLDYLKLCLKSLRKNSSFKHQIIIHVNEGKDGTLDFVRNNNYNYTNYNTINNTIHINTYRHVISHMAKVYDMHAFYLNINCMQSWWDIIGK